MPKISAVSASRRRPKKCTANNGEIDRPRLRLAHLADLAAKSKSHAAAAGPPQKKSIRKDNPTCPTHPST
jgi:hypothetical protein